MQGHLNKWTFLFLASITAAGSFAACGSSNEDNAGPGADSGAFTDGTDPNTVELHFDPAEATLVVDGSGAKTQSFVLKAIVNGITSDVTPESLAFDRPDIAKIGSSAPASLTTTGTHGGTGTLRGIWKGKEATAKLHVVVKLEDVAPGLDPAAVAALKTPPLAADPAVTNLLYPYDQTVWPLGLTTPLMMWNAPNAADVYRVHLEQSNFSYDGFISVAAPAQARVPQIIWDRITASNVGDPLKLELSRYDVATKIAYSSTKQSWPVAPASLRGAIYYWTTSAGGHMSRIRPGTGAAPDVLNGGKCMGCHAVSADGTTLVATVAEGSERLWTTFALPAAAQSTQSSTGVNGGNLALTPEGSYLVFGTPTLALANSKTGQVIPATGIETVPLLPGNDALGMPAFSPNGKLLGAVEGKLDGNWHNPQGDVSRLMLVDFDMATRKFANYRALATAAQFPVGQRAMAYPTFSPDSASVAYHVGDKPSGCESDGCGESTERLGQLWLQSVSGTAPARLNRFNDSSLNAADHNRTYEPTFNPIERGGYFWVVATSARDWGNKLTGAPNNGKKRLWVGAIDKVSGAVDPSHPGFFLEGQEEATTNMRGFWALASCTPASSFGAAASDAAPACGAGFECCSGFCDQGLCVDVGALACAGIGEQCKSASDCCNAPTVKCVEGVCKAPIVK